MTSFSIPAAAAPLLLALVPCVFSNVKTHETRTHQFVAQASAKSPKGLSDDRTPWWKPSALGIDNYS